ncbi:MAG: gliding motility-associated-like protein [Flavobacteriales bacterium]|jgi:gliding motility-associated-like protein
MIVPMTSLATHIVGGELYYEQIGPEEYVITLIVYRDCGPTNTNETGFDNIASVGIFRDGGLFTNLEMDFFNAQVNFVPVVLDNPCFTLPPDVCVEEAVYTETVFLPDWGSGYDLVYQRCCRNPSIININFPEDTGATFWAQIPGTNITNQNSNPQFNNLPPVALCANASFTFDHSASDLDGDSLAYSFCSPMLGGTPDFPAPAPPEGPPFVDVSWAAGFSANYPIASDPAFNINPETGFITGTANLVGQFVIGICVEEWRNGVLLSTTNRDFQFNVTSCDPNIIATIPSQDQFCDGLTFQFSQESTNATFFEWDFGDETTDLDVSIEPDPIWTYADTGLYTVTLVANPGWPCADTAAIEYAVYPVITPVIFQGDFECLDGLGYFDFQAGGDFDSDASFFWEFGIEGTPSTSAQENPQGINFGTAAEIEITLTVFDNGCEATETQIFEVPAPPIASIEDQVGFCEGLDFQFENNSSNADQWLWNFGVPLTNDDVSGVASPEYLYPDTGIYNVFLVASAAGTCPDTAYATVEIYWLLDPYFLAPDPECFEGNAFDFLAEGFEDNNSIFDWEFDGPASIGSSNIQNPSQITYSDSGTYDVTLTISANGCEDSYTAPVQIIPNATIDFTGDAEGCPPTNAYFDNLSVTYTTASYVWSFGDETTSFAANPLHTYSIPGTYDVSLTMTTTGGCAEVLSMTRENVVTIWPEPSAGLDIQPNVVSFLDPEIEIVDLSIGGVSCFYNFGDGGTTEDCNPIYTYSDAGYFEVVQTIVNEYGCTDIAFGQVAVEGFEFFAPNAITPNNDGINDVFLPVMVGVTQYQIEIYNRWGEIIFSSTDPKQPWTANVTGGEHYGMTEVYVYRAIAHDLLGFPHEFEGHIVLIR